MSKKWETITFDQIRKGDRIRNGYDWYGIHIVRTATADSHDGSGCWYTKENGVLVNRIPSATHLIERRIVPKPVLPLAVGSIVMVKRLSRCRAFDKPRPFMLTTKGWTDGHNDASRLYVPVEWEPAIVVVDGGA